MKNKFFKIYMLLIVVAAPLGSAFANEEFPEDTGDLTPVAPINDYILAAVAVAIFLAMYYTNKKIQTKNN